jgi:hypothetical protein
MPATRTPTTRKPKGNCLKNGAACIRVKNRPLAFIRDSVSGKMKVTLFSGRANPCLANKVAQRLGMSPGNLLIEDFPDGELHVEVRETVRGHDVYIVQPTGPLVAKNLLELLLISDACYRAGASRVTAVTPYCGKQTGANTFAAALREQQLGYAFNRDIAGTRGRFERYSGGSHQGYIRRREHSSMKGGKWAKYE